MQIQPEDIISFWYSREISPFWFRSTKQIDELIRDKFYKTWLLAEEGRLDEWSSTKEGCIALVILLDQFPLNMFRGQARGFSTEYHAIKVTKHAIEEGFDQLIEEKYRAFLYMPLMHSENLNDQDLAVLMYQRAGLESNLRFAQHHRDLIKRFGRFPHRNILLDRDSTQQEIDYLNSDSAFKG